ncbi:hypothetical protein CANARDRAFT_7939 [[Candida] arabinofermentans NRRL YB-2248]|uniref:Actin interacting protein 3 C-terminal domain-containing protein n=1 Tax=[Candida] arabinofermentans NRRL YB-2248 TaxID=983967 RepID=A0A1E4T0P0_9ASCO|nr:hypothetical protein CANARDRAFT_7939 [[Candida] arabinofermentans NRRL YB-2248]
MSNSPSGNTTPNQPLRSPMKKSRSNVATISSTTAQLLTSTKALLQSLTSWANQAASISEVSAKFVQVGDDFKALRKSYVAEGVEISDVKDIPNLLRQILEESLVLEPSQETLDLFLPKVGHIVAELMKTLKEKQLEYQAIQDARKGSERERSVSGPAATPNSSTDVSPRISSVKRDSATTDSISRLQNNNSLRRRASKRFSAYQTSKILSMNAASSPIPMDAGQFSIHNKTPGSPLQQEVSNNIKQSEIVQQLSSPKFEATTMNTTSKKPLPPIDQGNSFLDDVTVPTSSNKNQLSTVFLKLGNKVKKVEIKLPTSVANLRVLFTQKFGFSPSGSTSPPIYIQEGNNGIAYELEDVNEIKPNDILSLYEPDIASIVVKHMESQIDLLKDEMAKMEQSLITRIDKISTIPRIMSRSPSELGKLNEVAKEVAPASITSVAASDIEDLKFELSKARQAQTSAKQKVTSSINEVVSLIQQFQSIGLSPTGVISNPYMEHCKSKVSGDCENLVTKIDDLQDVIETLKLDISKRGSKPTQKQILFVQKELGSTKSSLVNLTKYMTTERKNWNARWQSELTAVLEEQEFFKEQETIIQLLEEDLSSADETYTLIVKCCEEMEKNPKAAKPSGPNLPIPDPSISTTDMRDALLSEVRMLKPDHDGRVEAIMKAEKIREKEKELLSADVFEEELGQFVGNEKLKKSGGIDEIERKRQMQNEANLKGQFGAI